MRRVVGCVLIPLGMLAVLVVLYDRSVRIRGVGGADVTVEFVVTDAESGEPINGARIGSVVIDCAGLCSEVRDRSVSTGHAMRAAARLRAGFDTCGGFTTR